MTTIQESNPPLFFLLPLPIPSKVSPFLLNPSLDSLLLSSSPPAPARSQAPPPPMALLLLLVLLLASSGGSDAAWCVCSAAQPQASQQKTLDFACGAGADCGPIQSSGACYNPNTVNSHCSYAANSYFQRKGQAQGSCDFSGTASVTQQDPSPGNGCTYPATPSAAGTMGTSSGTTATPGTYNAGTGVGGGGTGMLPGLGPSGNNGMSTDGSGAASPPDAGISGLLLLLSFFFLLLLAPRF